MGLASQLLGGALQLEIIGDTQSLLGLAERWERLLAGSPHKTVFQAFEPNAAWWCAVGSRDKALSLHVVVIREGTRDLALAPLMIRREGSRRNLVFLGSPYFDYHDVLVCPTEPRARGALLQYLGTGSGLWDGVLLDELPAAANLLAELHSGGQTFAGARFLVEDASTCPYVDLTREECFRRAVRKERIRAKARKLENSGVLRCVHFSRVEELKERFIAFKAMHSAQWLEREDVVGPFEELEVSRFFDELVGRAGPAGHLLLSELSLDSVPIAYSFGFVFERTYFFYRMAYERSLAASSPGHILLRMLLMYLREKGVERYDFMRGTYAYKYWYANDEKRNRRLQSC